MPQICCAKYCKNIRRPGLHFFTFPFKREEILEKWINIVGQENFKPAKHSVICSDHFIQSDYEVRPGAYKPRLKECAVPIRHNNNENIPSAKDLENLLPEVIEDNSNIEHSQKNKRKSTTPNEDDNDEDASFLNKKCIKRTKIDVEGIKISRADAYSPRKKKMQNKIKVLQQKVRRQEKKIKYLTDLFKKLSYDSNNF